MRVVRAGRVIVEVRRVLFVIVSASAVERNDGDEAEEGEDVLIPDIVCRMGALRVESWGLAIMERLSAVVRDGRSREGRTAPLMFIEPAVLRLLRSRAETWVTDNESEIVVRPERFKLGIPEFCITVRL